MVKVLQNYRAEKDNHPEFLVTRHAPVVQMLIEYAQIDPSCINSFAQLAGKQTCFGWEEPLIRIVDERE